MNPHWTLTTPHSVRSLWDGLVRAGGAETFFQTPVWSELIVAVFPHWRIAPLSLEFDDGNKVLVPFLRRAVIPGIAYAESVVPGVYGGPLFLRNPDREHWLALWRALTRLPNFVLIENPFFPSCGDPSFERRFLFTQVLDLEAGYAQVCKGFSKGHKSDIKAASKAKIEICRAASVQDIEDYYFAYRDSLSRWGSRAGGFYPLKLFAHLFQHVEFGNAIRLWLARFENKLIAGGWFFYHRAQVTYWHSAVLAEYMGIHPMHLLIDAVIRDACALGMQQLDLCPSGGLVGVEKFKNGFGARKLEFSSYRRLNPFGRAFRLSRYLFEHYRRQSSL